MNQNQSPTTVSRSDLYLTLAVSLRPPFGAAFFSSFTAELATDFAEMWQELALPGADHIEDFRQAVHGIADPQDLLVLYSRLFLTPPVPVSLNAGRTLDGAVMGGSVAEMETYYRRYGLMPGDDFHDLPDHLSMQLEFVARLLALGETGAAVEFLGRFVQPWMPDLIGQLDEQCGDEPKAACYLHLVNLLAQAVDWELRNVPQAEAAPARRTARSEALMGNPDEAAQCSQCGKPMLRDKQLRKLAETLAAQGLAADHLDTCPECRDGVLGFTTRALPKVVRGTVERRGKRECG